MLFRIIVAVIALAAVFVPVANAATDWECMESTLEYLQNAVDKNYSEGTLKLYIRRFDTCFVEAQLQASNPSATPRQSQSSRPTATTSQSQSDWNDSAIRGLVRRNAKGVRIIKLEISSSATTITYDLKPWPFVPNESIAEEVAFKLICGIRKQRQFPNTLKMVGHTHFKDDVGRKFKAPSVEIHISASNANRIVCAGNNETDISWRRLASRYKSYPIPRGAKIDY